MCKVNQWIELNRQAVALANSVTADELAEYLKANGWTRFPSNREGSFIFRHPQFGELSFGDERYNDSQETICEAMRKLWMRMEWWRTKDDA